MEKPLEDLLAEVKLRVKVYANENPITNLADAVRIADRNRLIYTVAQNGPNYIIRWREDEIPITVKTIHAATIICKRIVDVVPLPAEYDEREGLVVVDTANITPSALTLAEE